jgi:hypothetical protein
MSSKAKNINKQFSTLWLTAGYDPDDCNPNNLHIDLRVKGGALIKRNLCVLGNVTAKGALIGDLCGNVVTDVVQSKTAGGTITVEGNVAINPEFELTVSNACITTLQVNKIVEKNFNTGVCIEDVLIKDGDIFGNVVGNMNMTMVVTGNDLVIDNLDVQCGNVDNVGMLIVDNISSKTTTITVHDAITLLANLSATGDITTTADIVGDVITANGKFVGNLCGNVEGKVAKVENLQADFVTVDNGLVTIDNGVVTADKFTGNVCADSAALGSVSISGDLDMFCGDISNVESITVGNVFSKGVDVGTLTDVVAFQSPAVVNFTTSGGGTRNQFWGYQSGTSALAGATENTAIGYNALKNVTTGGYNTVMGTYAGDAITTGLGNTLIGRNAGSSFSIDRYNTVVGFDSAQAHTEGHHNTIIGSRIGLYGGDIGSNNTIIGSYALGNGPQNGGSQGDYNLILGFNSMNYGTTGIYNTAIGADSMKGNPNWDRSASHQIGIGQQSASYVNSLGTVAMGGLAMKGHSSMATTGFTSIHSVAIGYSSMRQARSGSDNTVAIGYRSLDLVSGKDNVAIGKETGRLITTGKDNTLVGAVAGDSITTGNCNVAFGYAAGEAITTGQYNVVIGCSADAAATVDYQIAIGNGATATMEDQVTLGRPAATIGLSATATADVWGQVFQNRTWDDATTAVATIDGTGNFVKGANIADLDALTKCSGKTAPLTLKTTCISETPIKLHLKQVL